MDAWRNVYDVGPGEVFWAASDVGWVVGHSYIVYAPLLVGATTVLYEGKPVGTPDASAFWRVIADHGVKALFTAPTAFRAIKKEDPTASLRAGHDLSSLRTLFLAGERLDPDTYHWASDILGIPVVDNWWQTETGLADRREPARARADADQARLADRRRCPATTCRCSTRTARQVGAGEEGNICLKLPLPPGTLPTLWNDDHRYVDSYLSVFTGYYTTGDGGSIDADGYVFVMGRTDDVINVAGHRLSTGVDGGGRRDAPDGGRVRRHRRPRPAQGAAPARVRRAQERCRRSTRSSCRRRS